MTVILRYFAGLCTIGTNYITVVELKHHTVCDNNVVRQCMTYADILRAD